MVRYAGASGISPLRQPRLYGFARARGFAPVKGGACGTQTRGRLRPRRPRTTKGLSKGPSGWSSREPSGPLAVPERGPRLVNFCASPGVRIMNHVPTHPSADVFPPLVLDGWYLLHQFFRIDSRGLHEPDPIAGGARARATRLQELLAAWAPSEEAEAGAAPIAPDGWSAAYRVIGGEADLLLLHFRPTLEALGEAERAIGRNPGALDLIPAGDYLSVVELGLYAVTDALLTQARADGVEPGSPEWKERVDAQLSVERGKRYVQARLQPVQPAEMPYVCFYPMDKRRKVGQNWYTLPLAERARLMGEHGSTGRKYAGRVSQIISGSVGLDDWEWAVTLFAQDPLDFKALVTEMRYDEVTSVYGEFGTFRVGHRIPTDRVAEEIAGAPVEG
jgi:hydrogen peroxide-dependent heme synthase